MSDIENPGSEPPRRASRIAIVDDNPGEAPLLREAIETIGWHAVVDGHEGPASALREIHRACLEGVAPDIILVDFLLVSETCIGFLERLRALSIDPTPAVALFSGMEIVDPIRARCYELGVLKIFRKPPNFDGTVKLMQILRRLLVERGDISRGGSRIVSETFPVAPDDQAPR